MAFIDAVKSTLNSANKPATPQEIREYIKIHHPEFFGAPSHRENVAVEWRHILKMVQRREHFYYRQCINLYEYQDT